MKYEDFDERIPDFSAEEIGETGSNIKDVQFITILTIQKLRTMLGMKIFPILNGITTGSHKSIYHPEGLAIDFEFRINVKPKIVVMAMLACGFTGIGVYRNASGYYSFHGDCGKSFRGWLRIKDKTGRTRDYSLFNNLL